MDTYAEMRDAGFDRCDGCGDVVDALDIDADGDCGDCAAALYGEGDYLGNEDYTGDLCPEE